MCIVGLRILMPTSSSSGGYIVVVFSGRSAAELSKMLRLVSSESPAAAGVGAPGCGRAVTDVMHASPSYKPAASDNVTHHAS